METPKQNNVNRFLLRNVLNEMYHHLEFLQSEKEPNQDRISELTAWIFYIQSKILDSLKQ
jgi:hypothetical protein